MNEKPLERLNYYNGRPLDAADFKTEQEYHIRTRRWLNKSLYTAGIARGLDVREVPGKRHVIVSPGLALDSDGREIILLEEADVEVCSYAGDNESTVVGNYLVIEYSEESLEYERGRCVMREVGTNAHKSTSHWGGPSRVEARPKFSWVTFVPQPGSNQVVLGRVELSEPNCDSVHQIDSGARQYIGAASAAKVRQYALEGEREVACLPGTPPNTATVYFHIRGRTPNAVTLFLKATSFSTLHYTEVGHHRHDLDIQLADSDGAHQHALDEYETVPSPVASELALLEQPDSDDIAQIAIAVFTGGLGSILVDHTRSVTGRRLAASPIYHYEWKLQNPFGEDPILDQGDYPPTILGDPFVHAHTYGSTGGNEALTKPDDPHSRHTHQFQSTLARYGGIQSDQNSISATDSSHSARGGVPLSYFENLLVSIDGIDRTDAIKAQIVDAVADKALWQAGLGNGTSNHPLANDAIDAVPIRLDFLPDVTFAEGQHTIGFSVKLKSNGEPNGGKVLYNLYVE